MLVVILGTLSFEPRVGVTCCCCVLNHAELGVYQLYYLGESISVSAMTLIHEWTTLNCLRTCRSMLHQVSTVCTSWTVHMYHSL